MPTMNEKIQVLKNRIKSLMWQLKKTNDIQLQADIMSDIIVVQRELNQIINHG